MVAQPRKSGLRATLFTCSTRKTVSKDVGDVDWPRAELGKSYVLNSES
jgi:hypothetical protein